MALAISPDYRFSAFPSGQGVGAEADIIKNEMINLWNKLYEDVATEDSRSKAQDALTQSVADCSLENWDGYGAMPVNQSSHYYAQLLLESLPPRIPNPEVGVDPDGEISLEWYQGPRQAFSISIAPNGDLSYAGIFGRNKVHGTESFDGEIPKVIMDNLKRFFSH